MAWPIDARDKSYTAGSAVPSSNLNELQDRMINIHQDAQISISHTASLPNGTWSYSHSLVYWTTGGADPILFPVPVLNALSRIVDLEVKVFQNGALSMLCELIDGDLAFDSPATAPSEAVWASASSSTNGAWSVVSVVSGGAITSAGRSLYLKVTPGQVGDRVAGLRIGSQFYGV